MVLHITAQSFAFAWLFHSSVSYSYIDICKKDLTASYTSLSTNTHRYELIVSGHAAHLLTAHNCHFLKLKNVR
jgi:hypothetical protein